MKKRLVKEKSSFHAAHKHNNDSVDFGDQHHDNYVVCRCMLIMPLAMLMVTIDQHSTEIRLMLIILITVKLN